MPLNAFEGRCADVPVGTFKYPVLLEVRLPVRVMLANVVAPAVVDVLDAVCRSVDAGTPPVVATVVTVPEVVKTVAVGFGTAAVAAGAIATAPVVGSAVIVAPVEPPMLRPFCTIKFAFAIFLPFSLHYPRN
jgi:hypothetical protein